jgi:hypothetical protein
MSADPAERTVAERREAFGLAAEIVKARECIQRFGIVAADTIAEEDVTFLSDRPPLVENAVNLVEGNPDVGKSLVVLDLLACLSAGRAFPFGRGVARDPRRVLFLTAEDSLSTTIVKRLRAADADLSQILVQQPTGSELLLPDALEPLRLVVRNQGISVVVMDPLNGYLDASQVDVNKEQQVRQALRPLRDFAEGEGVTVIGLRHLNKASDKPALYRGGGSIALTAVARSTLLVARHPEDPALRVVISQKCNLVPDGVKRPIAFRIGQDGRGRPRIEWLEEEIDIDADELLAPRKPGPKADTLETAKRYIRDHLADGPKPRAIVVDGARKAGLSDSSVDRAQRELGVVSTPQGKERVWSLL